MKEVHGEVLAMSGVVDQKKASMEAIREALAGQLKRIDTRQSTDPSFGLPKRMSNPTDFSAVNEEQTRKDLLTGYAVSNQKRIIHIIKLIDGEWLGTCRNCEEYIPEERIIAVATDLCKDCAEALEHKQK